MNAQDVNAAVSLISLAVPQAMAAYNILRAIWLRTNPGKNEADYLQYLQDASQQNVDESAAILKADGYVQDANGNWSRPK